MEAPFLCFGMEPPTATLPVLLSVPHAGRSYPPDLLAATRVSRGALAVLEDPLVDRLVGGAIGIGAAALVAGAPRALIDLNRSLADLDPAMISPPVEAAPTRRAMAGLGLIPARLPGLGAIWRRPLSHGEVTRRVEKVHAPYHDAIARALVSMRARFGLAVLLDCHSMPARPAPAPLVVLGDRHGTTCGDWLALTVEDQCARHGFATARNDPYAGGEIAARHGRPAECIHALQIEIDRSAYLAPNGRDPGPGFARTGRLLTDIVRAVAAAGRADPLPLAAE